MQEDQDQDQEDVRIQVLGVPKGSQVLGTIAIVIRIDPSGEEAYTLQTTGVADASMAEVVKYLELVKIDHVIRGRG